MGKNGEVGNGEVGFKERYLKVPHLSGLFCCLAAQEVPRVGLKVPRYLSPTLRYLVM